MKELRVLNIVESTMSITNQQIAIVELAEVKYLGISLPSGKKPFTFSASGETYVFDLNSNIFLEILEHAKEEEIVTISTSDFTERLENKDGRLQKIYYHKKIILI
ncbi:MAG: hypothetical protein FGM14_09100 [Flavobacteriales bacterium]|nr:hypothetical protein [Flavobacteriales bacterium]